MCFVIFMNKRRYLSIYLSNRRWVMIIIKWLIDFIGENVAGFLPRKSGNWNICAEITKTFRCLLFGDMVYIYIYRWTLTPHDEMSAYVGETLVRSNLIIFYAFFGVGVSIEVNSFVFCCSGHFKNIVKETWNRKETRDGGNVFRVIGLLFWYTATSL